MEKGTVVGEVTIILDGKPIASAELVTKNAVKKNGNAKAAKNIGKIALFFLIVLTFAFILIMRKRTTAAINHKSNENRKY